MNFQWWLGARNELVINHLDPISKTPECKYNAVRLGTIEDPAHLGALRRARKKLIKALPE